MPETNRRTITDRLANEGWVNHGGGKHDLYRHADKPGVITVPRHKTLSNGVARSIARAAGW